MGDRWIRESKGSATANVGTGGSRGCLLPTAVSRSAFVLAWTLCLCSSVRASELEIGWDVDRLSVARDETVTVTLQISWDGNRARYRLKPPDPSGLDGFSLGQTSTTQRIGEQRTLWQFVYRFLPNRSGELRIPPLRVQYLQVGADSWEEATSEPVTVQVYETQPSALVPAWVPLAVLVVALVGTGSAALMWRRRKARRATVADPVREGALRRLSALMPVGDHGKFCQQVSELLREYLEQRLGAPLRGKATAEALEAVAALLPRETMGLVRDVLQECDRGRFGAMGDQVSPERIALGCRAILTGEGTDES